MFLLSRYRVAMDETRPDAVHKGRGAIGNPAGRFEALARQAVDDGWPADEAEPPALQTVVGEERARTAIARNDSPDISFEASINPYRGCEHGCVYCYARPSHAYVGLSSGLDFESRLFVKTGLAAALQRDLRRRSYRPKPIMLGANTDAYQPIERTHRVTRSVLAVLAETRHPVAIVTKSALVLRDLDLLASMAQRGLVAVGVSVTTMDPKLARTLEPRAAAPRRRLETIRTLAEAGVRVSVMAAPMIPFVNDHELERILEAGAEAGAVAGFYSFVRLPHELKGLFTSWLRTHAPDRAERVLARIRDSRGGALYEAKFGERMTGTGPFAEVLAQRFRTACSRLGLVTATAAGLDLDTSQFRPPRDDERQLSLFVP